MVAQSVILLFYIYMNYINYYHKFFKLTADRKLIYTKAYNQFNEVFDSLNFTKGDIGLNIINFKFKSIDRIFKYKIVEYIDEGSYEYSTNLTTMIPDINEVREINNRSKVKEDGSVLQSFLDFGNPYVVEFNLLKGLYGQIECSANYHQHVEDVNYLVSLTAEKYHIHIQRGFLLLLINPKYLRIFHQHPKFWRIDVFDRLSDLNDLLMLKGYIHTLIVSAKFYEKMLTHFEEEYTKEEIIQTEWIKDIIFLAADFNKLAIKNKLKIFDVIKYYYTLNYANVVYDRKKNELQSQFVDILFGILFSNFNDLLNPIARKIDFLASLTNINFYDELIITALHVSNDVNKSLNVIKDKSKSASVFFDMHFYVIDYKVPTLLTIPLLVNAFVSFWGAVIAFKHPEAAKTVLWFAQHGKEIPMNWEIVGNPFNPPKEWNKLKDNTMTVIQIRLLQADGKWKSLGSYNAFHWWEINKAVEMYTTTIIGLYQHYIENNLNIFKIGFSYKHLSMDDAILKFRTFRMDNENIMKAYISDMNKLYNHIPHIWNLDEWKKIPGIVMSHINHVDGIYYMSNVPIFWVFRKEDINNEVDKSLPDTTVNIEFIYRDKGKIRDGIVFDKSGAVLTRFTDEVINETIGKPIFDYDLNNKNVDINNQINVIQFKRIFADGTELLIIDNIIDRAQARRQSDLFLKTVKPSKDIILENPNVILGTYDIETRAYYIPKEYETVNSITGGLAKEVVAASDSALSPDEFSVSEVDHAAQNAATANETLNNNGENANMETQNSEFVCDQLGKPIEHLQVICISVIFRNINTLTNGFKSDDDYHLLTYRIDDFVDKNQVMTNNPLDYIGAEQRMIRKFFEDIKNYAAHNENRVELFAHNGSQFDLVFLLNHLVKFENKVQRLNFLVRDSKFINTTWSINRMKFVEVGNGYREDKLMKKNRKTGLLEEVMTSITIKDSYLLLPTALAKAAKQFGVPDKGEFDFEKINNAPFDVLTKHMPELLEYNINDSKVLWNVLAIYNKYLVDHFKVSIFDCPTAAAIAFRVFRLNYLKQLKDATEKDNHNIPITSFEMYEVLKEAYLGGACDVYKPTNPEGTKVYTYDINSEYPSMMATQLMPTGIYKHIISNKLDLTDTSLVAFVKCKVYCPNNILVPLLPRKVKGKMVAGAGNWTGIYFSAEIREAISRGYQIEPIEAWLFEGKMVFDEFINDLYKMRLSYPKTDPMNFICKQIMNSTYGRFGMAPYLKQVKVLTRDMDHNYPDFTEFTEIHHVDEDKVIVASKVKANELVDENQPGIVNISLPIAAAITSYSRICIHRIKWEAALSGSLMYSDTDSVMTSTPIRNELIGDALGQLKLEYTAEKGIFISPKVYALSGVKDPKGNDMNNIVKAKGLGKNIIHFEDYYELLNKNNVYKTFQRKWFRDIFTGSIKIMNLQNMVRINEGKRVIILDHNDNFIDTDNVIFKDNEIISPLVINRNLSIVQYMLYYDYDKSLCEPQVLSYPPIIEPNMESYNTTYNTPLLDLPQVISLPEKLSDNIMLMTNSQLVKLNNNLISYGNEFNMKYLPMILGLNELNIYDIVKLINRIVRTKTASSILIKFLNDYIALRENIISQQAIDLAQQAKDSAQQANIQLLKEREMREIIQEKYIDIEERRFEEKQQFIDKQNKADIELAKAKELADTRAQAQAKLIIETFMKNSEAKLEANAKALAADLLAKAEAEKAKAEAEKAEALAKAEALEARLAALEAALLKGVKVEDTKVDETKVSVSTVDDSTVVGTETKVEETQVDSTLTSASSSDIVDQTSSDGNIPEGNIPPDEPTEEVEINDISDSDINEFKDEFVDQSEAEIIDYGDDEDDDGDDGDSSPPSSAPPSTPPSGDSAPPAESPPGGGAPPTGGAPPSPPSVDVITHKEDFVNIKDRSIEELVNLGSKIIDEVDDLDQYTDTTDYYSEIINELQLEDQSTIDLNTANIFIHEAIEKGDENYIIKEVADIMPGKQNYNNAKIIYRRNSLYHILNCINKILKDRDLSLARAELGLKGSTPKSNFITLEPTEIVRDEIIRDDVYKDITIYDESKYYEPIDKEIHDIIHAQVTEECRIKLAQMEKDSNVKDISLVDKSTDVDLPANNLNQIISAMDQNPDLLLTKDQMNYVLEQGSEKDPQGRKRVVFMSTAFVEQDLAEGKEIKFREIMDYSEAELRELGRRIKEDEDGYREVGNELYIDMQRMDDLQVTVNRLNEYIQTINSRAKLDKKAKLALEHLTLIKKLLDNQIYTKEDAMKTTPNHHLVGDIVRKQWDRETAIKALEIFRDTGRLPPTMSSERLESILGKPFEQLIEAPSEKSRSQAILAEVKAAADARLLIEEPSDKPQPYLKLPKTEISEFERHGFSLYINEGDPVEYMEIKSLFDFELQSTEDIIETIDRIEKYIKDIPKLRGLNKQQRISKRESLTLILNLFKDEINRRGGDGGPQGGSPIPPITSDNTPEKSENIIKEVKIPELRSSKPKSTSKAKPKENKFTPPSIISIDNIDKITNKDIRNMLKSIDFTAKVNEIQDQIEKFFNLENCKLLQLDDLRDVITYLNTRGLDDQEKINCKIFKQFALYHLAKTRIKIVNSSTTKFIDGTILSDLPDSELLLLENVITPFYLNGEYDRCRKVLRVNDHVAAHLLEIYYRLRNTNICPNMQKVIASKLFELGAFNTKPDKGKFDP